MDQSAPQPAPQPARGCIEAVPAETALARARGNPLRRYPAPDRDGDRLYPLAAPSAVPSFTIGPEDTVFAIGSCFARNIERALSEAGLRVTSREFDLGPIGASLGQASNFFNKYTIHSVLNELRWALERDSFPGADVLCDLGRGRWADPQLGIARLEFPLEQVLEFRHRYLDAMAQVATADLLVVTLGYVESWYDRKLGLYLNLAPPVQAVKAEPGRYEFRVLGHDEVLDGLEQVHALLSRHRGRPPKMLVTVSPVPLLATFRETDVLVANAYSKAVQRAAVESFVARYDGVDYFPSYEFVTLSDPNVAWSRGDYRHVSPDLVDRIMAEVLARYMRRDAGAGGAPGPAAAASTPQALTATMRMLLKLGEVDELRALAEARRDMVDADADALLLEAAAARRQRDLEAAFAALERARALDPARPDALERLITICRPLRRRAAARRLRDQHEGAFPERAAFRARLDWI
ncbi:GSCFA domain-containing protein [Limimaricola pyoseonensis]|uniref:GSCFA family protein n=1 Tax=Limimaricola pyoseonensis TaxID=521013 RepID=A0A1G6ZQN4_9RHOB|nr:GSCFA domain-containing protein [Limimaricola pyoseonensis]SDE04831.1 GSCFA family protein [Limimaricola pyoseonensis]